MFFWFCFFLLLLPVHADVMNLNNDMPTHLEDATPIDEHSFDIQYSAVLEKKDPDVLRHRPNLRYGATEDLQLEGEATIFSGGNEKDSGQTDLGILYRLNHSENYFPEISLSPVAIFPTGKGMDSMLYSIRVNLTTTLEGNSKVPITQLHFNYQLEHNSSASSGERTDRSIYTFGFGRLIFNETALICDALFESEREKSDYTYLLETGLHHHLGKKYFIGLSIGVGLGASDVDGQGLLAFEKQFD
ncbi:hypothetical protein ACJVC5_14145 [Peredibacter sp. HCB2-198]|uniref:hypothetical protein n=1 Tax=Peredibacter sp. HCB2-198 TaxID=3383025 RepID=UPI0038B4A817